MITKTIQRSEDCFVQFSDEELHKLGIKKGDKFSWELQEDGGVLLKKFATIDFDLADFDRSTLEFLISESCEKDLSVNDVISNILEDMIDQHKE